MLWKLLPGAILDQNWDLPVVHKEMFFLLPGQAALLTPGPSQPGEGMHHWDTSRRWQVSCLFQKKAFCMLQEDKYRNKNTKSLWGCERCSGSLQLTFRGILDRGNTAEPFYPKPTSPRGEAPASASNISIQCTSYNGWMHLRAWHTDWALPQHSAEQNLPLVTPSSSSTIRGSRRLQLTCLLTQKHTKPHWCTVGLGPRKRSHGTNNIHPSSPCSVQHVLSAQLPHSARPAPANKGGSTTAYRIQQLFPCLHRRDVWLQEKRKKKKEKIHHSDT